MGEGPQIYWHHKKRRRRVLWFTDMQKWEDSKMIYWHTENTEDPRIYWDAGNMEEGAIIYWHYMQRCWVRNEDAGTIFYWHVTNIVVWHSSIMLWGGAHWLAMRGIITSYSQLWSHPYKKILCLHRPPFCWRHSHFGLYILVTRTDHMTRQGRCFPLSDRRGLLQSDVRIPPRPLPCRRWRTGAVSNQLPVQEEQEEAAEGSGNSARTPDPDTFP